MLVKKGKIYKDNNIKINMTVKKGGRSGNIANLIPVTQRTKEEARLISAKGGRGNKNNPKSKIAARLRELRKKGLDDENRRFLHDMMTDSEMSAMHVLEFISKVCKTSDKPVEMNAAARTIIEWHKLKHGSAESKKTLDINIQMLSPEEKEKEISRLIEIPKGGGE